MFDPKTAEALVNAGGWTILVFFVGMIFVTGARETWVWGSTLKRTLADNAALRQALDANTAAMKAMSDEFVRALDAGAERTAGALDQLSGIVIHELGPAGTRVVPRRRPPTRTKRV